MPEPPEPENRNIEAGRDYRENRVSGDRAYYAEGDINIINPAPKDSPAKTVRDRREQFLLKAVSSEVESRLNQSLHNRIYIELDKEQDPNQVQMPWDMELKTGKNPSEQLPKETKIESIFDRADINGRLLILGAPGSGKTTTLLRLAKVLVTRARENPDLPVPVLLNLSSWKDEQSIADWIVYFLKSSRYGVPIDIGLQLIEGIRVLPLLDGLDELAGYSPKNTLRDRQELCVTRINEFLQQWPGDLVVCSRIEEYQHYDSQLELRGSIVLRPLRTEQIRDYVMRSQGKSFWLFLQDEMDLLEIARIPLMLNIMIVARGQLDLERLQQLAFSEKRLDYLLEAYIDRMLRQPRSQSPSPEQARRWLGWLAAKLIQENETEFFIEKIQPYWLDYKIQKLLYRLISTSWIAFIFGLIAALSFLPISLDFLGGAFGLVVGLIFEATNEKIKPAEAIRWKGIKVGRVIAYVLARGSIVGIIFAIIFVLIVWSFNQRIIAALIFGANAGLILGAIAGLIIGVRKSLTEGFVAEIENKTIPNQGIRQSLLNFVRLSIISYFPSFVLYFLLYLLLSKLGQDFKWFVTFAGSFGLALIFGIAETRAFIEHFVLRLILCWNGYAPWNYARFLDYATKQLLMQRVGGGYRFLHRLLQEHFADRY